MAIFVDENFFKKEGGYEEATAKVFGHIRGTAAETSIIITPGASTQDPVTPADAASRTISQARGIRKILGANFTCTTTVGSSPQVVRQFEPTLSADQLVVTFLAGEEYDYELVGTYTGQ